MPDPCDLEFEVVIEKVKSHKSLGIDQIPAELIKAGGRKICYEIHKLIISILNKEELPVEWKEATIIPVYKKGNETDCIIIEAYQFANYVQNFIQYPAVKVNSICRVIFGDHQCGIHHNRSTTDHIFCILQILEKKWEYNEAVHQLFIDFKKAMIQLRGRPCIIFSWSLVSPLNW